MQSPLSTLYPLCGRDGHKTSIPSGGRRAREASAGSCRARRARREGAAATAFCATTRVATRADGSHCQLLLGVPSTVRYEAGPRGGGAPVQQHGRPEQQHHHAAADRATDHGIGRLVQGRLVQGRLVVGVRGRAERLRLVLIALEWSWH